MKIDYADISQFGQRSKAPAVKNNISRATDIGFDLIRQCSELVCLFFLIPF